MRVEEEEDRKKKRLQQFQMVQDYQNQLDHAEAAEDLGKMGPHKINKALINDSRPSQIWKQIYGTGSK